jgi:hypothetical protein
MKWVTSIRHDTAWKLRQTSHSHLLSEKERRENLAIMEDEEMQDMALIADDEMHHLEKLRLASGL